MLSLSLLSTSDSSNNYEVPSSGNYHYGWKIKSSEFFGFLCSHSVRRLSIRTHGTQHVIILMAGIYFRDTVDLQESMLGFLMLYPSCGGHTVYFSTSSENIATFVWFFFLLRHLPGDPAPMVFIGSLSGRHPLPRIQENSRLQKDSRCSV